tara:strand:+ start:177 stop:626 length:450 start_codon:yes stop_codon:yes gene_type:complete
MNFWKEIKSKTWIDWVKVVVAIDVAGVGIGLILGFNLHVFAFMLGFVTRLLFGLLYVFLAVLIFKRVFPQDLAEEEHREAVRMDEEIKETSHVVGRSFKKLVQKVEQVTDKTHEKIDHILDKSEDFIGKRKQEINEEVDKLMSNDSSQK